MDEGELLDLSVNVDLPKPEDLVIQISDDVFKFDLPRFSMDLSGDYVADNSKENSEFEIRIQDLSLAATVDTTDPELLEVDFILEIKNLKTKVHSKLNPSQFA